MALTDGCGCGGEDHQQGKDEKQRDDFKGKSYLS
jgi:hypothetical protein